MKHAFFRSGTPIIRQGEKLLDAEHSGIQFKLNVNKNELSFSIISESDIDDVQISFPLAIDASWKSYVIAPGAIYNGNRFLVSPQLYCPYIPTEGVSPNAPILCTDVPRLTSDTGYRVELAANVLTIPAVGIYDSDKGIGYLAGLEVYGKWGTTGINITTLPGEPVTLEICLPVRRKKRYRFCDWIDADEKGMSLKGGQSISGKVSIKQAKLNAIPELITLIAEYGHEHRGTMQREQPISFSDAGELIESKLDEYNWDDANKYYTESGRFVANPTGAHYLQTGWTGGGVTFYALSCSSNENRRKRAIAMIDMICRTGLTPSGYFHGCHTGKVWKSFGLKRPGCRAGSLIRRPLECTRDLLKVMELLRGRGQTIKEIWTHAAKSNLDAMVDTTKRFGHLGYTVDFDNGDVLWGDSACGSFAIEPLVRGARWFEKSEYLKTACALAEYYVENFVRNGYTCGGVGDALMAVDSESNYALLAGLTHLYKMTNDPRHLKWASLAADLFSTWVLSYDAKLPADSTLGKLGIQPRGAVFANIQNQHGAAGICTASGLELSMLSEMTGQQRYLDTLRDIANCIPQMVVREESSGVWKIPLGSISERLMTCDGMCPCGETDISLSTWSEISLLLTACELPGSVLSA